MRSLLLLFLCTLALSVQAQRNVYNFNYGWKLFVGDPTGAETPSFNDEAWKKVSLPYAWNEDDAFLKDIVNLRTGIAWYRKTFTLPEKITAEKYSSSLKG
jgi:beta-galactosidase